MKDKKICGIQQIGIGYSDIKLSWRWYRKYFGMDVPVFEDIADATLMQKYTGNKAHSRYAILAMNIQGGGGFELWQFLERTPEKPIQEIKIGDFGIFIVKIKSRDIQKTYQYFKEELLDIQGEITKSPAGYLHFYLKDAFGNLFEIIENNDWFCKNNSLTGGVAGVVIGVSQMEKSLKLYQKVLGFDHLMIDKIKEFEDLAPLNGGQTEIRRVILQQKNKPSGGFSALLGNVEIELIERKDQTGVKIYQDRFWGDTGFIHVCFDVIHMNSLKQQCANAGFPFSVDSQNSFDMGKAAGHFSYIEDPDGTLIEFVETHKVPIMKKWGIYLNMKSRNCDKDLPKWMIKLMGLTRVKD
jgi:catechol 2,3-dioxygenase-like lactoylglutathione lyase family enzyme